jgi:hypothetical protein
VPGLETNLLHAAARPTDSPACELQLARSTTRDILRLVTKSGPATFNDDLLQGSTLVPLAVGDDFHASFWLTCDISSGLGSVPGCVRVGRRNRAVGV